MPKLLHDSRRPSSNQFDRHSLFIAGKQRQIKPSRSTPATWFSYDTLPHEDSIRILRLDYIGGDQIKGSLRTVRRTAVAHSYDCISYCWSPQFPLERITVNDRPLQIGNNLHKFLKRLPLGCDLWVDAICIDQTKVEEKNHQVWQMRDIYKSCRLTRVWLGELELARSMPLSTDTGMNGWTQGDMLASVRSDYWSRLWIVQEFILSPSLELYIGDKQASWQLFENLIHPFSLNEKGLHHQAEGEEAEGEYVFAEGIFSLEHKQRQKVLDLCKERSRGVRMFADAISRYGDRCCSDIRDRVYGLLGLFDDFALIPDYNLSEVQLFEQVMNGTSVVEARSLAKPLLRALQILPPHLGLSIQRTSALKLRNIRFPIRIFEFGRIVQGTRRLFWNEYDESRPLFVESHRVENIKHEDRLYSLRPFKEFRDSLQRAPQAQLFVVLRPTDNNAHANLAATGKTVYDVVGTASFVSNMTISLSDTTWNTTAASQIYPRPAILRECLFSDAFAYSKNNALEEPPKMVVEVSAWDLQAIESICPDQMTNDAELDWRVFSTHS